METMIEAMKGNADFMQEYQSARKERNGIFDRINKSEKSSVPKAQDYIDLGKANQRVFEVLYYLR